MTDVFPTPVICEEDDMIIKESGNITLDNSSYVYTYAHGLGKVPKFRAAVLVCIAADAGLNASPGDEFTMVDGPTLHQNLWVDATNLYLCSTLIFVGNEAFWATWLPKNGSLVATPTSFTHFALKFYYA
jgi:hypothetical protein